VRLRTRLVRFRTAGIVCRNHSATLRTELDSDALGFDDAANDLNRPASELVASARQFDGAARRLDNGKRTEKRARPDSLRRALLAYFEL